MNSKHNLGGFGGNRRLQLESLEGRQLMAGNLMATTVLPLVAAATPSAVYGPAVATGSAATDDFAAVATSRGAVARTLAGTNNTIATATNLGEVRDTTRVGTGSVGGTDPVDYWRFVPSSNGFYLTGRMNVNIQLTGMSADLDLYVLDRRGNVLARSIRGGSSNEQINVSLSQGTEYFIKVVPFGRAVSNYRLSVRT